MRLPVQLEVNPWQMAAPTETESLWPSRMAMGKRQAKGAKREADIQGKHTNNGAGAYL